VQPDGLVPGAARVDGPPRRAEVRQEAHEGLRKEQRENGEAREDVEEADAEALVERNVPLSL
jgi:hypothetical protein